VTFVAYCADGRKKRSLVKRVMGYYGAEVRKPVPLFMDYTFQSVVFARDKVAIVDTDWWIESIHWCVLMAYHDWGSNSKMVVNKAEIWRRHKRMSELRTYVERRVRELLAEFDMHGWKVLTFTDIVGIVSDVAFFNCREEYRRYIDRCRVASMPYGQFTSNWCKHVVLLSDGEEIPLAPFTGCTLP